MSFDEWKAGWADGVYRDAGIQGPVQPQSPEAPPDGSGEFL